ncbi:MAG: Ig-like domain-containing protein [Chloroflexi bacterium]|nr:Ig-like domain-containing protein [Chloroflexota bacterium]
MHKVNPPSKKLRIHIMALMLLLALPTLVSHAAGYAVPGVHAPAPAPMTDTILPTGLSGLILWLDAADPDGDGNSANNPADGAALTAWIDKSGQSHNATQLAGQNAGAFRSDPSELINGQPVVRFTRTDRLNGSVYEVPGVDLRAATLEDITIFTVYRPKSIPDGVGAAQGIWGVDNGNWDRFFMPYHEGFGDHVDDGLAALGLTTFGQVVTDAGQVGKVRLLTAVYDGAVTGSINSGPTNGSAIYFDGQIVARFTDSTHPTDAQPQLYVGWDGDDNAADSDIAEMMVYNRALSGCEIQRVNEYLAAKYGRTFVLAPGGIFDTTTCNLQLWLKADTGLTPSTGTVTSWIDQVGISNFTVSGSPQTGGAQLNYNNVISLDGSSDAFVGDANLDFAEAFVVAQRNNDGVPLAGEGAAASSCGAYFFRNSSGQVAVADADPQVVQTTSGDPGGPLILNGALLGGANGTASYLALNGLSQPIAEASPAGPLNPFARVPVLGRCGDGSAFLNGQLAEAIVYRTPVSDEGRQRIDSYLALKYGITLGNPAAPLAYTAANGTVIWNADATYQNNVAGIGRDDTSTLNQKQARSVNTTNQGDLVVLALGTLTTTNVANINTFAADRSFLVWGDNNGSTAITTTQSGINNVNLRMGRIWKVQETGSVGSVQISIPNTTTFPSTNRWLLVSNDGVFDGAGETATALTDNGTYFTATVDLNNGQYFSFGSLIAPAAPTLVTPTEGGLTNDATPSFTGTGEAGVAITVTLSPTTTTTLCTATAATNGAWQCDSALSLNDGLQTVVATASNIAGSSGPSAPRNFTIDTIAPPPPSVTSPTAGSIINNGQPTFAGGAEANSTVKVSQNATPLCTATTDPAGQWSCTPFVALENAIYTFSLTATDATGNISPPTLHTFTIDSLAPLDYGDAPDPTYPTRKASQGARHSQRNNNQRWLGAQVDTEPDGQPNANATGDDTANNDDDDGVTLPATLVTCERTLFTVQASAQGYLNAWVDFNNDGDWADVDEQIVRGVSLGAGANLLSFFVPCQAKPDSVAGHPSFARFRFSAIPNLSFLGDAPDGEVEDYAVSIVRGGPSVFDDVATTSEDQAVLVNVLGNDRDPNGQIVGIAIASAPLHGLALIEGRLVRYIPAPNYFGPDSFTYTAQNDIGKRSLAAVKLTITPVNDPPTAVALTNSQILALLPTPNTANPAENFATIFPGTIVGKLQTTDADPGDSFRYQLSGGNGLFSLSGNNLTVAKLYHMPVNSTQSFALSVKSTDLSGAFVNSVLGITFQAPPKPPGPESITLATKQVGENQPVGTVVSTLSTVDSNPAGGNPIYTLVNGAGSDHNSSFQIVNNQLQTAVVLDYYTRQTYSIRLRTTNTQGAYVEQSFVINATRDPNKASPWPLACLGDDLTLLKTNSTLLLLTNLKVKNPANTGCDITGKLTVRVPGSQATDINFSGYVNQKNQVYSDPKPTPVFDMNAPLSGIAGFKLSVAGLGLEVEQSKIEYYADRISLRIARARWCMPEAWSGLCVHLGASDILIDGSGVKPAVNIKLPIPNVRIGNSLSITALTGSLLPVAGGYEISAGGEFGLPKLSAGGNCKLAASVTIYTDAGGNTVIALEAVSAADVAATDAVGFREVAIGLSCDKGIPIGATGFELTGVRGKLSLRPDAQYVQLGVTVDSVTKWKGLTTVRLDGDARLLWEPAWGFDLEAALKLFSFFEAAHAGVNIRERQFRFYGEISAVVVHSTVQLDIWSNHGYDLHLAGSGRHQYGLAKGALYKAKQDIICHKTIAAAGCGVAKFFGGLFGAKPNCSTDAWCTISISVPPIDLRLGSTNGDFGEFVGRSAYGIKSYVALSKVVGETAQSVLKLFSIPKEFGVFIDTKGHFDFGGVSEYKLVKPPPIAEAFQTWQMAQASGAARAPAADAPYNFLSTHQLRIAMPLTAANANEVQASGVISQVEVTTPAQTVFIVTAQTPVTVSLIAPDGTMITPQNYNQAPVTPNHTVVYTQSTVYQLNQFVNEVDANAIRLRFVHAAPGLGVVNVLDNNQTTLNNIQPPDALNPPPNDLSFVELSPDPHTISLQDAATQTTLITTTLHITGNTDYTLFATNFGKPGLVVATDKQFVPPDFRQAYFRLAQMGDAERHIRVVLSPTVAIANVAPLTVSDYVAVTPGEYDLRMEDATTGELLAPVRTFGFITGTVITLVTVDLESGEYPLNYYGLLDAIYVPQIYTVYSVDKAMVGEWQLDLDGDLTDPNLLFKVLAYHSPAQLDNVTVDASNLADTVVNYTLHSEFAPTLVRAFVNPGELNSTLPYTDENGLLQTDMITQHVGFPMGQVTIADPTVLAGAPTALNLDLSSLPSGQYRVWLEADDAHNPPKNAYARQPGSDAVAVITVDHSANFPTTWTAVISTALSVDNEILSINWAALNFPDIDSYNVHLGTTPGVSEQTVYSQTTAYPLDDDGQPTGPAKGAASFSHLDPNTTYYVWIEAVDEQSGRSVLSQAVEMRFSSGSYSVNTPVTQVVVEKGLSAALPITVAVQTPLYDPNVSLTLDESQLPLGVSVEWVDDKNTLTFQGVTAAAVPAANGAISADAVHLQITVDANTTPGEYPLDILAYNGVSVQGVRVLVTVTAPSALDETDEPSAPQQRTFFPLIGK